MSIQYNPKITYDSLQFFYDMSNYQKSWKGAPTTNSVANSLPLTGWLLRNYLTSDATLTFEEENQIPHLKLTNVVADSAYPRLQDSELNPVITDGFSVSYEAKGTPGAELSLSIYSGGSTKSSSVATLTTEWQRFTFNNISTGFTLNQPYLRPLTTGAIYYVRKIQIEQNTFATPFVNGTRSNTESILDITGNNTVTVNDLAYNSDNTFSFNGVSSYLDLGTTTQLSNNFTLSVWHKNANTGHILDQGNIGTDENGCLEWTNYGRRLTANNIASVSTNTVIDTNIWNNVVCSFSHGLTRFYINGILDTTVSATFNSFTPYGHILKIGRRAFNTSVAFSGSMPTLMIYSRVLSDAEVLQNFNATKSRYGL